MERMLEKTLNTVGRACETFMPDEDTARRIGKRYMTIYHVETSTAW